LLTVLMITALSASASARDRKPPKIHHTPIAQAQINKVVEVRVAITDRSGVFDPTLYYRTAGATEYLRSTLVETGAEFVATIPAAAVTADIEYFVEAYDELGNGPARVGGPSKPLRVAVSAEAPPANGGSTDNPAADGDPDNPVDPDDPNPGSKDDPDNSGGEGSNGGSGGDPDGAGGGEVDEEEEIPWAIIGAAAGGAVLLAAGVVAAVLIIPALFPPPPPGEVTIVVSGPAPYSLRGEP